MKNRIEVSCPHCESTQVEPSLAISTFCRSCGQHFKIAKKAEKKRFGFLQPKVKEEAFAIPDKKITPHELKTRPLPPREETPAAAPAVMPEPVLNTGFSDAPVKAEVVPVVEKPTEPEAPRVLPLSLSEILSKGTGRQVLCFECPAIHQVPADASSTICPSCSTYINLQSVDIRNHSSQRIQTRGDVTIHKKGSHIGGEIRCHDLVVLGEVSGTIDASGTITFKHDARVQGEVRCAKLVVDKKVTVKFEKTVLIGGEAEVDGDVTGDIECGGSMRLHKNACLDGSLRAAGMAVDPGAELLAETEIVRRG